MANNSINYFLGKLNWQAMQDTVVEQSALLGLARAIILLHEEESNRNWTVDTIIAILNELLGKESYVKKLNLSKCVL